MSAKAIIKQLLSPILTRNSPQRSRLYFSLATDKILEQNLLPHRARLTEKGDPSIKEEAPLAHATSLQTSPVRLSGHHHFLIFTYKILCQTDLHHDSTSTPHKFPPAQRRSLPSIAHFVTAISATGSHPIR